jgi:nucleosome assembly protein 1-like 1
LKGKKGVPDFWAKALKTSGSLKSLANEKDLEALEHCLEVEAIPSVEGKLNFTTLRFVFKADNDFFTNTLLEVKCMFDEAGEDSSIIKTEGTEIEWLEGKDTTKKKIKKKQKHKKTGETRTVMKTVQADSFFNIF